MVGVSRLLTFKRIALTFAVLLMAVAVAGKLATAASSQGPSASFTFNPASPLSGEQISFNSSSTDDGSLSQWEWDFDDGDTGSGESLNHTFAIPGMYTVALTVTDDEGLSDTAQQTVTVQNREPSADFDWNPASPFTGENVSFRSLSSDPEDRIASQRWDLDNDGEYDDATGGSASRSFPAAGPYTVSLLVEDQDGGTSTISRTVDVADLPNVKPDANFSISPASPTILDNVTFTSTSTDSDGSIASYAWDLDNDGAYNDASGSAASKMFPLAGTYTIGLLVTDNEGETDTVAKTVTVGTPPNDAPTAAFHFSPSAPNTNQTVTFTSDATDDGAVALEEWDFEADGTYDTTGSQVQRAYATAGTYTVRLRVTDDKGVQATTTKSVNVTEPPNDAPTAAFHFSPSSPKSGEAITFTSDSTDDGAIVSQLWDLNNDGTWDASEVEFQHAYAVPGTYTVRLRVTDDKNVSRETTKTVTVANRAPTADFTYDPVSPRKGQTITFSSLATDPENRVQSVTWDLDGDGQYDDAAGITAQTAFDTPGNHIVRLRIDDLDGGSHTASKTIAISNEPPVASFTIDFEETLSLVRVTFTSTSTDPDGTIAETRWDTDNDGAFDDGGDVEANRVFTTPGLKTVRLRVKDDNGTENIATRTVNILNRAPTAKIEAPTAAQKNVSVVFKSTSSDLDGSIAKTEWDLDGDGQFDDATSTQPSRSFSTTGPKTVRLRVTDNTGATDEATHVVEIGGNTSPTANFTISASNPLTNTVVTFTSTSSDPDGSIAGIGWDLDGDGNFDDGSKTPITKSFPTPGPQIVRLRVTDNDGASTVSEKTVNVANRAPTASVEMLPQSPTSLEQVTFTAVATDPDGTITSILWDLDNDGRFDEGTGVSITHPFPAKGTYTVKVRVTDNSNASATGTRIVTVSNRLPIASFSHAPGSPNPRERVVMTSTSTDLDGTISKIEWDTDNDGAFDDGTGMSASRTFTTSGIQTVRLRVTDNDGGESIGSQTIVVGNRAPTAAFDYRPAAPIADQQVTFFSTSDDPDRNIESVEWDLDGDGSFETGGSSVARSFPTGSFNVSVRVTDTEGAFSIATQTIVVSAPPPATQPPQISSGGNQLRLLNPFPIIRIAGRIGTAGTRFRLLSVNAPSGSTVTVRCKGKGCPFKASKRSAKVSRQVRIRKLERRLLRAGASIRIFVTKPGTIGKYTSIRVRKGKPPRRSDRCLMPDNNTKPVKCPS
jgi:PKD repeat protein